MKHQELQKIYDELCKRKLRPEDLFASETIKNASHSSEYPNAKWIQDRLQMQQGYDNMCEVLEHLQNGENPEVCLRSFAATWLDQMLDGLTNKNEKKVALIHMLNRCCELDEQTVAELTREPVHKLKNRMVEACITVSKAMLPKLVEVNAEAPKPVTEQKADEQLPLCITKVIDGNVPPQTAGAVAAASRAMCTAQVIDTIAAILLAVSLILLIESLMFMVIPILAEVAGPATAAVFLELNGGKGTAEAIAWCANLLRLSLEGTALGGSLYFISDLLYRSATPEQNAARTYLGLLEEKPYWTRRKTERSCS